jgi:hypothetical protein
VENVVTVVKRGVPSDDKGQGGCSGGHAQLSLFMTSNSNIEIKQPLIGAWVSAGVSRLEQAPSRCV